MFWSRLSSTEPIAEIQRFCELSFAGCGCCRMHWLWLVRYWHICSIKLCYCECHRGFVLFKAPSTRDHSVHGSIPSIARWGQGCRQARTFVRSWSDVLIFLSTHPQQCCSAGNMSLYNRITHRCGTYYLLRAGTIEILFSITLLLVLSRPILINICLIYLTNSLRSNWKTPHTAIDSIRRDLRQKKVRP